MTFPWTTRCQVSCVALGVLSAALFALAPSADAQAFRVEIPVPTGPILAEATAGNPETVRLLTGLAKIESDLQLGLLFLKDGLVDPEGSHFTHPRIETLPALRDGLAAAGVADIEPFLVALEAGGDEDAVMSAFTAATGALMKARSILRPSTKDMLLSIVDQARAVAAEINPTGPTELANYQDAWAMLTVARTQIDLLVRNEDPAVAKAARDMALAFDDVILSMPDPNAGGPVTFDPAPILAAIGILEGLAGSV